MNHEHPDLLHSQGIKTQTDGAKEHISAQMPARAKASMDSDHLEPEAGSLSRDTPRTDIIVI